jgi:hypothetical protein
MMRLGRLPLFSMRTSEELREEGHRERLIGEIANQPPPPFRFEPHPWFRGTTDAPHPSEKRRDRDQ